MPSDSLPAPFDHAASRRSVMVMLGLAAVGLSGCAAGGGAQLPSASFVSLQEGPGEDYIIGPLDELTIFVWRNPELGAQVQVRPDGRITTPLITDMPAVGKTPSMLAEDIKLLLSSRSSSTSFPALTASRCAWSARPKSRLRWRIAPI